MLLPLGLAVYRQSKIRRVELAREKLSSLATIAALWFAQIFFTSVAIAPQPAQSIKIWAWMLLSAVGAMFVYRLRIDSAEKIKLFSWAVGASALVSIAFWLVANLARTPNIFVEQDYSSSSFRLSGLMPEPNLFASLAVFAIVILLFNEHGAKVPYSKTIATICVLAVFLTVTRAAWVTLAGIAVVLLVQRKVFIKSILFGAVFAPMTYLLLLNSDFLQFADFSSSLQARVDTLFDFENGTGALRRLTDSEASAEMLNDNSWIFGHGFNSYPQLHEYGVTEWASNYLANLWIAVIYDGGLVSFMLLLGLLAVVVKLKPQSGTVLLVGSFSILASATSPVWFGFVWVVFSLQLLRVRKTHRVALQPVPIQQLP